MVPGRNILLFHAGALGDFIVTWPLVLALARLHPQSRLFCVTQRGKGLLAERVLRVESVDSEVGWHALHGPDPSSLPESHTRLLAGAHSVVSFAADVHTWPANVRKLAPSAEVIALTAAPPADFSGHVTDHLLGQLAAWPAAQSAMEQVLRSVASRGIPVGPPRSANGPVVVHPGSGAARKCWPAERFLQLIDRLRAGGREVRVIIGEVELEQWGPNAVDRFAAAATVVKPATPVELLDQLKDAAAFVGNDSGPSHLAGIIGVPTVALFGPSNPIHWRPLGPNVKVIHSPALEGIEVGQVIETL